MKSVMKMFPKLATPAFIALLTLSGLSYSEPAVALQQLTLQQAMDPGWRTAIKRRHGKKTAGLAKNIALAGKRAIERTQWLFRCGADRQPLILSSRRGRLSSRSMKLGAKVKIYRQSCPHCGRKRFSIAVADVELLAGKQNDAIDNVNASTHRQGKIRGGPNMCRHIKIDGQWNEVKTLHSVTAHRRYSSSNER